MGRVYIAMIDAVARDYYAALDAFAYTVRTWQTFTTDYEERKDRSLTKSTSIDANTRLDATYFIRLTAEFEGILKQHLRSSHPAVRLPVNARIDWLIKTVKANERSLKIPPAFRAELNAIRDFRNDLAHKEGKAATVLVRTAIAAYHRFLTMPPDPRD